MSVRQWTPSPHPTTPVFRLEPMTSVTVQTATASAAPRSSIRLIGPAGGAAGAEHHGRRLQGDGLAAHLCGDVHHPAWAQLHVLTVAGEPSPAAHHDVQLLLAAVLHLVVRHDQLATGVGGVRVDAEALNAEMVADAVPAAAEVVLARPGAPEVRLHRAADRLDLRGLPAHRSTREPPVMASDPSRKRTHA